MIRRVYGVRYSRRRYGRFDGMTDERKASMTSIRGEAERCLRKVRHSLSPVCLCGFKTRIVGAVVGQAAGQFLQPRLLLHHVDPEHRHSWEKHGKQDVRVSELWLPADHKLHNLAVSEDRCFPGGNWQWPRRAPELHCNVRSRKCNAINYFCLENSCYLRTSGH